MSICAAFAVPHPPLIVPGVGHGREAGIQATVDAYREVARRVAEIAPDTIVLSSPHSTSYLDYLHISGGSGAAGTFAQFGDRADGSRVAYDRELVDALCEAADACGLAAGTAALAHTGLAQASTSEAFSKKTRPVDTMNRIGGWTNGSVEVIDIKGVRIGEGRPKLIAPTTSKTEADLIATVKKFADMPALNVIEVRIDYLGNIDPKDYARITRDAYAAAGDKVVLVTLRNGTDGGPFIADDEWYGRVYEAVLTEGRADIVDLELFRDRAMIDRLVKLARQQGVKVIISDHEFNFTPDEDEIIRRLMLEEQAGADILKIAVMAHSPEDALAVMSATAKMRHYHSARPMLTMAMGRAGVLTRITGEGFGSDMTFASVGGKASAPGQIPAEDCLRVLETLHKAMNP